MKTITALFIFTVLFTFTLSSQEMMMSSGSIDSFVNLEDAQMQAKKGPVVLFFHAGWCPTCKDSMRNLESRKDELGDITVFVVDYDSSKREKRKYGVTYQHTFVQIDSQGKELSKWSGGDVDEILDNVVRMEMN
ncbi:MULTISPECIES: thioredoxin family protein [unclassified Oceanispirochaeta]|uniref:TlpA family protein disulfide reductase n=1 Tax=unclassified Oceanispirochaeta TaxID=2635722 RepID=UPI000E08D0EA|nr:MULTISPECIES: thioredoxin family protein [unclassified Oceanispirochaeta]MBF9017522.1 thioredoxin family protein [Oceanispirochaeta sp. M2]NPD74094.1 thioredoxin family protein [Oceanispirochaeta sp. M1]RDG30134.1 thioredoxin [Oceanispirochaeta sp. M1]